MVTIMKLRGKENPIYLDYLWEINAIKIFNHKLIIILGKKRIR